MTTKTKPETLPLEEKEETLYAPLTVKRIFKKPFVAYIRKSPLKVLNKMALNESEYDTLRAAQPKGTAFDADCNCRYCTERKNKYKVEMMKKGMAQGKKEEREAFKASFGWAADVKYWLAKRAELEREAPKK